MKTDPSVETPRLIVYQTVQWARIRGLTNAESMGEAAELLERTRSRIWTLLYRSNTLNTIGLQELSLLYRGFIGAARLYERALRDKADHMDKMKAAILAEERAPEMPFGESDLDKLLLQTESDDKTEAGRPLWRRVLPQRRPRKVGECQASCRTGPVTIVVYAVPPCRMPGRSGFLTDAK
jgi:hypothetical protein